MSDCKYDNLSIECFDRLYWELDRDEQIEIEDLYTERNE